MDENTRRQRRARRSPAEWARIVSGLPGSGLSAEDYAKREGIGVDSLWRWSGRLRREGAEADPVVSRAAASATGPRFLAVEVTEARKQGGAAGRGAIEVAWPGGPVVRLSGDVAASTIAAVLRAVAEVTPC